jgi:hypothetical protein
METATPFYATDAVDGTPIPTDPDDATRWAPPPPPPERARWRSFEEMRDTIARVGDLIELDERTGDWYRRVQQDVDRRVLPDGRVQVGYRTVRRAVALSAAEARQRADCDSHNGWSFVRYGLKVEREYPENLGTAGSVQVEWRDVEMPPEEAPPAGAAPRPRPRTRSGG